jgi:hypothetical protein
MQTKKPVNFNKNSWNALRRIILCGNLRGNGDRICRNGVTG